MVNEGRHIPNRLRKHRRINGYKQSEVVYILGLKSSNRLSRWEQGLSMPSVENLIKLSILYHVLIEELYFDLRLEFITEINKKKKQHSDQKM